MPKTPMAFTEQEIADLKTAAIQYILTLNRWRRAAQEVSDPDRAADIETEAVAIRDLITKIEYFQKGGE